MFGIPGTDWIPVVGGLGEAGEANKAGVDPSLMPSETGYAYGNNMGESPVSKLVKDPNETDAEFAARKAAFMTSPEQKAWEANAEARKLAGLYDNKAAGYGNEAKSALAQQQDARFKASGLVTQGMDELGNASNSLEMGLGARDQAGHSLDMMNVAYNQSNQARGFDVSDRSQQQGLINSYQGVLDGKAPSVAALQMQQGMNKANTDAMAMAASARGGGGLLAMRNAQSQQAANALNTAADTSLLRAKEQDMARAGMGGMLGQMRGQDQGMRGQDFQLAQGYLGQSQGYQQNRAQDIATATGYQNNSAGYLKGTDAWHNQEKIDLENRAKSIDAESGYYDKKNHVFDAAQGGGIAYNNAKAGIAGAKLSADSATENANAANKTAANTALLNAGASAGALALGGGRK